MVFSGDALGQVLRFGSFLENIVEVLMNSDDIIQRNAKVPAIPNRNARQRITSTDSFPIYLRSALRGRVAALLPSRFHA